MSKIQKALLFCSALCYGLVIYGFFHSASWLVMLFFILHSLALLYFCYLTYSLGKTPELETELASSKDRVNELSQKNERLTRELQASQKNCEELNHSLETARDQIREQQVLAADQAAKAPQDHAASSHDLLPPLSQADEAPQTLDIIQLARETAEEFTPFSQKAGIQVQISAATDTLLVKAHKSRIRILLRNIIDNSIKYMNRSGSLVITMSTVGDDIFIVLKDNGNGLSASETPHIFEMNYQGSNRISGNGLGLTQAKAIVDSYGGTIYAKSTIGKGMGIYIQIPID